MHYMHIYIYIYIYHTYNKLKDDDQWMGLTLRKKPNPTFGKIYPLLCIYANFECDRSRWLLPTMNEYILIIYFFTILEVVDCM